MKLRKLHYLFINARKFLNNQALRLLYFAMTQSILQYGVTAWGGLGIIGNNKIFRAQKSIIKIILNKQKTYSTKNLFNESKVFTFQQLFYRNALYYTYKFDLIEFKPRYYNTRLNNKLEIPTARLLKSSRCVFCKWV